MIKTKQIKTAKATILVIGGLPEGKDFSLYEEDNPFILYWDYENNGGKVHYESCELPPGEWKEVGFLKDVPEAEAKELVDKEGDRYFDYEGKTFLFKENVFENPAYQSLRSLVAANCELENKYGEKPTQPDYKGWNLLEHLQKENEWQAEEEKVFRNPFILKKLD